MCKTVFYPESGRLNIIYSIKDINLFRMAGESMFFPSVFTSRMKGPNFRSALVIGIPALFSESDHLARSSGSRMTHWPCFLLFCICDSFLFILGFLWDTDEEKCLTVRYRTKKKHADLICLCSSCDVK